MAARGDEFYLLASLTRERIRIPTLPFNILYRNTKTLPFPPGIPGMSQGTVHGKRNDKCISLVLVFRQSFANSSTYSVTVNPLFDVIKLTV